MSDKKKQSKIQELLEEIRIKRELLSEEYEKLKQKYGFSISNGNIKFTDAARKYQEKFRIPLREYVIPKTFRHILSIPFIYGMIIPSVILDIFLFVYQQTAMRLYGIPLVKRREYIKFDRHFLSYLNILQKVNCLYCSYVNGLFSYAVEIAGRTEKYWCPIKAAQRKKWGHEWEQYFADYGDPEGFKKEFNSNADFLK